MEEIGTDYQRLALKAGDLSFKISAFKKDLALLQDQMQNLNFEALTVQRADEEAKKKAAEAPVATVTPINAPTPAPAATRVRSPISISTRLCLYLASVHCQITCLTLTRLSRISQ
jgi:hypothetical protein